MLNYLPVKGGVSSILSSNTIMPSETLHYKRHLGVNIGKYCQVHEHEDPRNSQVPRTKGAIFIGPSVNEQGGYDLRVLNLKKNHQKELGHHPNA